MKKNKNKTKQESMSYSDLAIYRGKYAISTAACFAVGLALFSYGNLILNYISMGIGMFLLIISALGYVESELNLRRKNGDPKAW